MEKLKIRRLDDGRRMIEATIGANELPVVRSIDLSTAWETAGLATEDNFILKENDPEGILFKSLQGDIIEFKFDDQDALYWATAIHREFDLTTLRGLSLCFRMLALYQLMARHRWARELFTFDRRNSIKINKALLSAAAIAPLCEDGSFDPEGIRREAGTGQLAKAPETLRL